jgi:hypothetical protein
MNERTLERTGGFDRLADDMTSFARDLAAIAPQYFGDFPLAAE